MEFILGCNYWASHAGTDMWRYWDEDTVREDLKRLSGYGVKYLRVFPNWRDFQPAKPLYTSRDRFKEYVKTNDEFFDNPYFLDYTMVDRFAKLCEIADEYGCKLIVGLVTGWMSGRMFIPPALYGRNLFTDFTALYFQQQLCKGLVLALKDYSAIYAWDLGNECNCMSELEDRDAAVSWTAMISNTIRAYDKSRPIVSGMHSMNIDGPWTIADQGEHTDILTTHPYPHWVAHGRDGLISSQRTLLAATAESVYYTGLGHKPCLVEEIGTMGPMICDDQTASNFLRVNMFSNWANGQLGTMWWCANEQSAFNTAPYRWNMCERELGMFKADFEPKPVIKEMKKFSDFMKSISYELPQSNKDGVCLISRSQDHWGTALMSYILAKQAGANITFCSANDVIPEAPYYLLPSIKDQVMDKQSYDIIKQRVYDGAKLYISNDFGFLTEFAELTGVHIYDSESARENGSMELEGTKLDFYRERRFIIDTDGAQTIARDHLDMPVYTVYSYGKGKVYYLNFPLEKMIIDSNDATDKDYYLIYKEFFKDRINEKIITTDNSRIGITEHPTKNGVYAVLVNYSSCEQKAELKIKNGYEIVRTDYGNTESVGPYDATVVFIENKMNDGH